VIFLSAIFQPLSLPALSSQALRELALKEKHFFGGITLWVRAGWTWADFTFRLPWLKRFFISSNRSSVNRGRGKKKIFLVPLKR
jgi:hypothetical protein